MAACALIFAVVAFRAAPQFKVLALTRNVAAGQVLAASDLTVVAVSESGGEPQLVPASQESDWIGRTLTGPLPAGQLLTPANLGPSAWPPAGQGVVAVLVQAGHLPAGVLPGVQVRVVLATAGTAVDSAAGAASGGQLAGEARSFTADVVAVSSTDAVTGSASSGNAGTGGAVVSLLMTSQDAAVVAASSASDVSLILQGHGAGG